MADTKNEAGKTSSTGKDTGAGGKVSAGTSVGNIGETPMPQAHDAGKNPQTASPSASASTTSAPGSIGAGGGQNAGGDTSRNQSSNQGSQSSAQQGQSSGQQGGQGQGGSMADQARQSADQVRQKAGEAYEQASDWAQDTYERVSDWASDTYEGQRRRVGGMGGRSTRALGSMRGGVQNYVSENPMVVGLVGLAAGLLLGALLPRTRRENEVFGEWADEVRNQGLRYAREAANKGREYVEEAFSGDDARFSRHESEFDQNRPDANRH